jgi:hypothetical protein
MNGANGSGVIGYDASSLGARTVSTTLLADISTAVSRAAGVPRRSGMATSDRVSVIMAAVSIWDA